MTTLSFSSVGFKPQFDYGDLPEALQTEAESVVSRVRVCLRKTNTQALELAHQINHLREQMLAQQFKGWLSHYFPDAESQIRNWLKIVELAERLPEYVEQMMGWGTSAIATLSGGSDELVKTVLSGSEKLTITAIKALIREERGEQKPSASSSSTSSDIQPSEIQPSKIAIELAKLTAYKVDLEKQLTLSITPEAEEQLRYYIKQAELEIQQLCEDFDPAQIGVAMKIQQQRTDQSGVNTNSEEFQRLRFQLESEQRKTTELSNQLEQLRQQLTQQQQPSLNTDVNANSQEVENLHSQLQAELQKNSQLLSRVQQLEQQFTQQYHQQVEQLQQQLQQKEELIAQLQNRNASEETSLVQPQFVSAQLSDLKFEKNDTEPEHYTHQLEVQLKSTQQQWQDLKQWQERLQQKIHHQLKPGVVVEVLFDSKGIWTGCLGTVLEEFECNPGHWWISIVQPHTQKNYRELFPAYQLYLAPF